MWSDDCFRVRCSLATNLVVFLLCSRPGKKIIRRGCPWIDHTVSIAKSRERQQNVRVLSTVPFDPKAPKQSVNTLTPPRPNSLSFATACIISPGPTCKNVSETPGLPLYKVIGEPSHVDMLQRRLAMRCSFSPCTPPSPCHRSFNSRQSNRLL